MKVWEKCNEVKGTNATKETIAEWAYFNRICPLMFDCGLDIYPPETDGYPPENGFEKTARKVCETHKCGMNCLNAYLDSEFIEVESQNEVQSNEKI